MNIEDLKELVALLNGTDIAEMEIQKDDFRLRLRKTISDNAENSFSPVKTNSTKGNHKVYQEELEINENIIEVQAPMVGTFYAASSPDSAPFVSIGDHVEKGQTLCIVEAMKLMNEIKAEAPGTIVDILVDNAEAVEYGQPIFLIEQD